MKSLTGRGKSLIGMVHARALPGTPRQGEAIKELCRIAVEEARLLEALGFDAVLVENMHDVPYLRRRVGPEIVAAMTAVVREVRAAVSVPVGVQVLAGANREALAVALAAEARFIRAEGFVFAHVADEGLMNADAGELLRYRRAIGAEGIAVLADIKKKHSSHAVTADVSLGETARAAEFFGADGVIVTGSATGCPVALDDLRETAGAVALPVVVGSGVTPDNLAALWPFAAGFIVGSYLKRNGRWDQPMDSARAEQLLGATRDLRQSA
jgi:hypothetical protein